MGTCASVHNGTAPESAMKLGVSFSSKKDKLGTPESPINDNKHSTANPPIKTFGDFVWWDPFFTTTLKSLCRVANGKEFSETFGVGMDVTMGSKEESFFDSRAWIDSDCEDDFYSVNGDFTPSRGNTPVHHNFAAGTPQANKNPLEGRPPGSELEPSPTGKKRLSDLFKDRIREDRDADGLQTSGPGDQNIANGKVEVKQTILDVLPKSANTTPYLSGTNSVCSSERTANGDALSEKEKSFKSTQRCLPSLIFCRSFSERKKKSPAIAV
ncbi:hypothetical protein DKX38_025273 [Salix brachista]|uniref:Uncharacterized protein n=1 Tax=Salix brachista TaxID=2182728 RepID=A0A5N5JSC5_9ROSI|nr:hypothetical protein DKX38_025273 [Salix brachista]